MSADETPTDKKPSQRMKGAFASGHSGVSESPLFLPSELDLYVNKVTQDAYIFHGKAVEYDAIDHLEYHPSDYTIDVIKKDGTRQDLGVKLQWMIRPYFAKAKEVNIVQTKDGESINGVIVKLVHKPKK